MRYLFVSIVFTLTLTSTVLANSYNNRCSGEGCDALQRIRGVADGAYAIGKDNNTLSVAFVSTKTLQGLKTEALTSFLPYQNDSFEADKLRFQVAKECVFFEKGAYGSHLPRYTATNLTEPVYPTQELDLHMISASSFWMNLRRIENIIASQDPTIRLQYTWIRDIPADPSFPAQDELFAAPCALAISWIKTRDNGVSQKHMILRGGVTD